MALHFPHSVTKHPATQFLGYTVQRLPAEQTILRLAGYKDYKPTTHSTLNPTELIRELYAKHSAKYNRLKTNLQTIDRDK